MGGQGQCFLGASNARLFAGLLLGLDDELSVQDLKYRLQGTQGKVRATGEHATELSRIAAGGLTKLLSGPELAIDHVRQGVTVIRRRHAPLVDAQTGFEILTDPVYRR